MTTLEEIESWLNDHYNDYLTTYQYEDYVRLTNESAAHYVDIYPHGGSFVLEGENYGTTINTSCDSTKDALLDALDNVL